MGTRAVKETLAHVWERGDKHWGSKGKAKEADKEMEIETGKGGWQGDGQEKRNGNMEINKKANKEAYATYHFRFFVSKPPMGRLSPTSVLAYFAISLRKPKVYLHDTTLRSQNAEQLRENGWLRCSRKPQSFKTYDSSEFGVWSSYTVREAYKPLNIRKTTLRRQ